MSALRVTSDSNWESLVELRGAIAMAYDQVQAARSYLTKLGPSHELSTFLQSAEADLVRAMVAFGQIEHEPLAPHSSEPPIPISNRQSNLSRSA